MFKASGTTELYCGAMACCVWACTVLVQQGATLLGASVERPIIDDRARAGRWAPSSMVVYYAPVTCRGRSGTNGNRDPRLD
jgi:hypothetical protein